MGRTGLHQGKPSILPPNADAIHPATTGEEVALDLGEPIEGHQLAILEIDGRTLEATALLHGSCGPRRERGTVEAAAGAGFDFGLVLENLQLRLGQIENLAALDAVRSLAGQGATTARGARGRDASAVEAFFCYVRGER